MIAYRALFAAFLYCSCAGAVMEFSPILGGAALMMPAVAWGLQFAWNEVIAGHFGAREIEYRQSFGALFLVLLAAAVVALIGAV